MIAFIEQWTADRPWLRLSRDNAGNLWIEKSQHHPDPSGTGVSPVRDQSNSGTGVSPVREILPGPIIFQAHLDHPAFVVTAVDSPREATAEFRGGVRAEYFTNARLVLHSRDDGRAPGVVAETTEPDEAAGRPYRVARLTFDRDTYVLVGDIATWDLPPAEIRDGLLHAPACDDLAAVAAALCAIEELITSNDHAAHGSESRATPDSLAFPDIRLLLTRAEEVGFIGTIAACRSGTIPPGSRIIALENSRAFADSPVGAGPIVRVGDRLSVFSPALTAAVAKIAQDLMTGGTIVPLGPGRQGSPSRERTRETPVPLGPGRQGSPSRDRTGGTPVPPGEHKTGGTPVPPGEVFRWQRKLMAGGACEATAFCAFGHEATCLCLPLGNYHNMGRLDEVEADRGRAASAAGAVAAVAPEFVSVADFHNLVDLLVACGRGVGAVEPMSARLEKLYNERSAVLDRIG